jgi:hypothetical protein
LSREADPSPPSSARIRMMELYIHSPIRLHGSVFNQLSTGTIICIKSNKTARTQLAYEYAVIKLGEIS